MTTVQTAPPSTTTTATTSSSALSAQSATHAMIHGGALGARECASK